MCFAAGLKKRAGSCRPVANMPQGGSKIVPCDDDAVARKYSAVNLVEADALVSDGGATAGKKDSSDDDSDDGGHPGISGRIMGFMEGIQDAVESGVSKVVNLKGPFKIKKGGMKDSVQDIKEIKAQLQQRMLVRAPRPAPPRSCRRACRRLTHHPPHARHLPPHHTHAPSNSLSSRARRRNILPSFPSRAWRTASSPPSSSPPTCPRTYSPCSKCARMVTCGGPP